MYTFNIGLSFNLLQTQWPPNKAKVDVRFLSLSETNPYVTICVFFFCLFLLSPGLFHVVSRSYRLIVLHGAKLRISFFIYRPWFPSFFSKTSWKHETFFQWLSLGSTGYRTKSQTMDAIFLGVILTALLIVLLLFTCRRPGNIPPGNTSLYISKSNNHSIIIIRKH